MLSTGIIEVDVHGMNRYQAQTCLDNQLKRVKANVYQLRVIHGYHGGTELRDMIWREYRNHDKVLRVGMGNNPGETVLILREL